MRAAVLIVLAGLVVSTAAADEPPTLHVAVLDGWATVTIDGEEQGWTPLATDVTPGEHVVELQSTFHAPWRERIVVPPRARLRLDVSLEYRPVRVEIVGDLTGVEVRASGRRVVPGADGVIPIHGLGAHDLLFLEDGRPFFSRRLMVCLEEPCVLPGSPARVELPPTRPGSRAP